MRRDRSTLPVLLTFLKLPKLLSFHILRLAAREDRKCHRKAKERKRGNNKGYTFKSNVMESYQLLLILFKYNIMTITSSQNDQGVIVIVIVGDLLNAKCENTYGVLSVYRLLGQGLRLLSGSCSSFCGASSCLSPGRRSLRLWWRRSWTHLQPQSLATRSHKNKWNVFNAVFKLNICTNEGPSLTNTLSVVR